MGTPAEDTTPSAWGTASNPLSIHHGQNLHGSEDYNCIMQWWGLQIQISIIRTKEFHLITFIIQMQILHDLTC